ncbi:Uncharacterised protein [Mycobacteroides abscessus subsp. abscessus]|nr:Uncharacterised protein [Mycobacteroides abscessus subsp. abscessus]
MYLRGPPSSTCSTAASTTALSSSDSGISPVQHTGGAPIGDTAVSRRCVRDLDLLTGNPEYLQGNSSAAG